MRNKMRKEVSDRLENLQEQFKEEYVRFLEIGLAVVNKLDSIGEKTFIDDLLPKKKKASSNQQKQRSGKKKNKKKNKEKVNESQVLFKSLGESLRGLYSTRNKLGIYMNIPLTVNKEVYGLFREVHQCFKSFENSKCAKTLLKLKYKLSAIYTLQRKHDVAATGATGATGAGGAGGAGAGGAGGGAAGASYQDLFMKQFICGDVTLSQSKHLSEVMADLAINVKQYFDIQLPCGEVVVFVSYFLDKKEVGLTVTADKLIRTLCHINQIVVIWGFKDTTENPIQEKLKETKELFKKLSFVKMNKGCKAEIKKCLAPDLRISSLSDLLGPCLKASNLRISSLSDLLGPCLKASNLIDAEARSQKAARKAARKAAVKIQCVFRAYKDRKEKAAMVPGAPQVVEEKAASEGVAECRTLSML